MLSHPPAEGPEDLLLWVAEQQILRLAALAEDDSVTTHCTSQRNASGMGAY